MRPQAIPPKTILESNYEVRCGPASEEDFDDEEWGNISESDECLTPRALELSDDPLVRSLGRAYQDAKGQWSAKEKVLFDAFQKWTGGNDKHMKEILCGAHVILSGDAKAFYHEIIRNGHLQPYVRTSSHVSPDTQYGVIPGPHMRALLVGTTANGDSWFQLENSAWGSQASFQESFWHAKDYFSYVASGENQGPFGASSHTDKSPLRLKGNRH